MTSLHSHVTTNSDGCGIKCSKEHIMVTPIVSASGEKLIPREIGKSKQPYVFQRHWYWQEITGQIWFPIKGMTRQFINVVIISFDCWCCLKLQINILITVRHLQFTCVCSKNAVSWRIARHLLWDCQFGPCVFPTKCNKQLSTSRSRYHPNFQSRILKGSAAYTSFWIWDMAGRTRWELSYKISI